MKYQKNLSLVKNISKQTLLTTTINWKKYIKPWETFEILERDWRNLIRGYKNLYKIVVKINQIWDIKVLVEKSNLKTLRKEYEEKFWKKPFTGWKKNELLKKIKEERADKINKETN